MTNLPTVIDSLIASPPNINSNTVDIPSYLSALTSALVKMSLQDPESLSAYIPRAFNLIYHDMLLAPSPSPAVMIAASEAIGSQGLLRYCITDEMIVSSVNYKRQGSDQPGARKKQKTPFLSKMIAAITESLDKHALRIQYLLPILAAAISRLRLRVTDGQGDATVDSTGRGMTAAQVLLLDLIKEIADLKNDTGFEHKAKVDEVVGMAIEVIGVEGILSALPLNIEPDA
jgi:ribosomal RNA-processing protein 12